MTAVDDMTRYETAGADGVLPGRPLGNRAGVQQPRDTAASVRVREELVRNGREI